MAQRKKKLGKIKLRTRKSALKRTKISGTGKVMVDSESTQHQVAKKSNRTKAKSRRPKVLGTKFAKNMRALLPYANK